MNSSTINSSTINSSTMNSSTMKAVLLENPTKNGNFMGFGFGRPAANYNHKYLILQYYLLAL